MTKINKPATAAGVAVAIPAVYADMMSATDCGEVIVLSFFGLGAGNGGVAAPDRRWPARSHRQRGSS
jgi:hypothetical protein